MYRYLLFWFTAKTHSFPKLRGPLDLIYINLKSRLRAAFLLRDLHPPCLFKALSDVSIALWSVRHAKSRAILTP
jgi:hypothetical protein